MLVRFVRPTLGRRGSPVVLGLAVRVLVAMAADCLVERRGRR